MAKQRRGRHEGGLYKRKSDGLWVGNVSLGFDAEGRRIRKTVYAKSKTEVKEKMQQLQQDALNGLPVKAESLTVDQHFQDWFRVKAGDVKETTLANYKNVYNANIKPHLGHVKVKSLDYRRINALFEQLQEKGLTRTISMVSFLLRSALEDATRKGLVPANQAKLSASRRQKEKEARYMNQEEIKKFFEAAKGERLENALILAVNTGLRPGEWCGLPWSAVDWKNKKVSVSQALIESEGKVWIDDVKTEAGRRIISLSETAMAALRQQKKRQLEEEMAHRGKVKEAAEKGKELPPWENKQNLVFTNENGGLLYRSSALKRLFNRVNKKAGLEGVTPHTLRHTHASILIFQGVDPKTICARLGHTDVAFTLQVYGHLFPGKDESAAEELDVFFKNL